MKNMALRSKAFPVIATHILMKKTVKKHSRNTRECSSKDAKLEIDGDHVLFFDKNQENRV